MGRTNKTGQSKSGKFIALPHHMITSPAFRSLSGGSLKVYIELNDRYNGSNNGSLHLSCGAAAKLLHLSKSTVSRAFRELSEKGLIRCTSRGNWYEKRASTWALTHRLDNRLKGSPIATNEWHNWKAAQTNGQPFYGTDMKPDGYRDETSTVPK